MWIVVGDTTTGEGSVVSGSPFTDIDGKPVARISDKVVCARHGPMVIVSGDPTMLIDGQPVARHGDGIACGCSLISTQQTHVFIASGGAGSKAALAPSTTPTPSPTASGLPPSPAPTASRPAMAAPPPTANAPACWVADHSKTVSAQTVGRYFEVYDKNGVKHAYNITRKFKVTCPLKTGGNLLVEVKIKAEAQRGVTAADVTAAKTALERASPPTGMANFQCKSKIHPAEQSRYPLSTK